MIIISNNRGVENSIFLYPSNMYFCNFLPIVINSTLFKWHFLYTRLLREENL